MITNKIHISEIFGGRLDPHQFHPERMDMLHHIFESCDWCKLKDVVKNTKTISTSLSENDIYIGLENIARNTGDYTPTNAKESISSAAVFKKGDILFPKLRPYLNKVHKAEFNGKCSTEFHVFEATTADSDYLTIVLRSNIVLAQTKHLMTGNTLPRLQTNDIENIIIPLPTFKIQKEIVELYSKAQTKKQSKEVKAKTLLESIDNYVLDQLSITLPKMKERQLSFKVKISDVIDKRYDPYYHKEYFVKAFESLSQSKTTLKKLKEISSLITSGITPLAGGDAYTNIEDGVAFIRSGNIDIDGDIRFDDLLYLKKEVHNTKMKSSKVLKNDIMIAIVGATIGQVGIYHSEQEANINQAIALVRIEDANINQEYVKEVVKSSIGQLSLNRLKRPVARANINLEEISSILIPIPAIKKQNDMVKHILQLRAKAKQLQKEGAALLETEQSKMEKMILG